MYRVLALLAVVASASAGYLPYSYGSYGLPSYGYAAAPVATAYHAPVTTYHAAVPAATSYAQTYRTVNKPVAVAAYTPAVATAYHAPVATAYHAPLAVAHAPLATYAASPSLASYSYLHRK